MSELLPKVLIKDKPITNYYQQDNTPDDDEELDETPPSVVSMLGFDPLWVNE